jgi:catechol 2,3-dioxygenase-like lactoylglutathione lyase family enzyme
VLQVGIVPRDLERSMAFYRDTLGLEYLGGRRVIEGRTLHMFSVAGGILKLIEFAAGAPEPTSGAAPGAFYDGYGLRWITMPVDDLDAIAQRCHGRPWQMPITELRPGLRVAIVEDPDGIAVEFVERTDPGAG